MAKFGLNRLRAAHAAISQVLAEYDDAKLAEATGDEENTGLGPKEIERTDRPTAQDGDPWKSGVYGVKSKNLSATAPPSAAHRAAEALVGPNYNRLRRH